MQFLSHVCVRLVLGHKNALVPSATERQDEMRWSSRISRTCKVSVSVQNRKKLVKTNFIVVSAAPSGTQDPRQASA